MRAKTVWAIAAACVVVAALVILNHRNAVAAGDMPSGHGIKCLKADGHTPCTDTDVSGLSFDISGIKNLVTAGKTAVNNVKGTVSDVKGTVSDVQQASSDGQQLGSDAKQLGSDAKSKNLGQGVSDGEQTATDSKTAEGDAKQVAGDAQQVLSDLKGIGSVSLKSTDGAMNCVQNNGSPCNDNQTKALQAHAAQKSPPLTIQRDADQPSN